MISATRWFVVLPFIFSRVGFYFDGESCLTDTFMRRSVAKGKASFDTRMETMLILATAGSYSPASAFHALEALELGERWMLE
jgi:hypothetical protein